MVFSEAFAVTRLIFLKSVPGKPTEANYINNALISKHFIPSTQVHYIWYTACHDDASPHSHKAW
jgi:hypothetical protein